MYNHKSIESEIQEFWEKNNVKAKVWKARAGGKPFYLCDGPPYVTGEIHPGTGWNKIVKDAYVRYLQLNGYNVRAQSGFDTHGLPIEVKVEKQLGIKNKSEIENNVGIEKFIKECKAFANKYIDIMSKQFESLGVWMDFENPYITYKDAYIEASWNTIKEAEKKSLLEQGYYVVPYCYRCETTMANYELEYGEETDPSIFVKFKIKGKENEYIIIWTTTPWTLVANMACMVNPEFEYVKANVNGEIWILAKERLEHLMDKISESPVIIESFPGKSLEGIEYEHPFEDVIGKRCNRKVVLSDKYVTLEEGTGIVHCAPGHGPEDYEVGKEYGIEIFSPVDEKGNYTAEAGALAGKNVRVANKEIINILKERNALITEERIKHRYPHCWRCKTPLIFLTTKQWFINISRMKDKMLQEIPKVKWYPSFAMERFQQFVSEAPNWCISRQRYWGIPLPIWICERCSSKKVVGSRSELGDKYKDVELHKPYIDKVILKCKCGGNMYRVKDVLDVWFDSGNAVWASLTEKEMEEYGDTADLIIEGQDQIRGWFYSLLGSGMLRYGGSPYKRVIMHGFFVDEKGEKMSKSVGNFVPITEILDKYGADSFRLWALSNAVWNELKFNWEELKEAHNHLNIFYNLVIYLTSKFGKVKKNSIEIDPKMLVRAEDIWMYSRINSVIEEYKRYADHYHIHKSVKILREFIVDDLSRFYMKIAKERISSNEDEEICIYLIAKAIEIATILLSPIVPYIAEWAYVQLPSVVNKRTGIDTDTVHISEFPKIDKNAINNEYEKGANISKDIYSSILMLRQNAKIKTRWPLRYAAINIKEHAEEVAKFSKAIGRITNIKIVEVFNNEAKDKIMARFKDKTDVKTLEKEAYTIFLDSKISEELYREGIFNEVKRRIQFLRKKLGLTESDHIYLYIIAPSEIINIVKEFSDKIRAITNADDILYTYPDISDISATYTIDGKKVEIHILRSR